MNVFLIGALFASFIMICLSLQAILTLDSINDIDSGSIKLLTATFIISLCLLYLGQNASSYYNKQLDHKYMLAREKLRIKSENDGDITTKEVVCVLNIIDAIIEDVEGKVTAIKVAGIRITPRIMMVIRGYVGTAVITIITIFISKN